jgi:hypothetical protein
VLIVVKTVNNVLLLVPVMNVPWDTVQLLPLIVPNVILLMTTYFNVTILLLSQLYVLQDTVSLTVLVLLVVLPIVTHVLKLVFVLDVWMDGLITKKVLNVLHVLKDVLNVLHNVIVTLVLKINCHHVDVPLVLLGVDLLVLPETVKEKMMILLTVMLNLPPLML